MSPIAQPRVSFVGFGRSDQADENQPLLTDVESNNPVDEGLFPAVWHNQFSPYSLAELPVYNTIHRIRADVLDAIDDNYSLEQLKDQRMNVAIIRPLVDKYYKTQDISVIYCLLVNRVQFKEENAIAPHQHSVNITRALLCELVANRILRRYNEANPGPEGLLLLANVLVGGFDCFQKAPPGICQPNSEAMMWIRRRRGQERKLPALEVAIISDSKSFLSSSACQRVITAIYQGRVVYTPGSFMDIIPDVYKQKPIALYDPRHAPLLNQYRLIVPRTRNFLEVLHFVILLMLYIAVMNVQDPGPLKLLELTFIVYCLGWVLDQVASILEHGWKVYTQNLWSFLDVMFIAVYAIYFTMRLHGLRVGSLETGQQALDVLALGAPVLIPRLAFNLMSENMLFVSLRSMIQDFSLLTLLAVWCFAGFLMSMIWLGDGSHRPVTISKWMLWVWFGLDGTGIQRSVELHTILGPVLMVLFAFLGNTLFLTILVSMLSNTFAAIANNASAEIQFRRAVLTLQCVKADAIFAFYPPLNLVAVCILVPLRLVVTPRWFHKINVAAVRTLNAPLLLMIGYMERRSLWASLGGIPNHPDAPEPKNLQASDASWSWSRFSVHGDIAAVFQTEPPVTEHDINEADDTMERLPEVLDNLKTNDETTNSHVEPTVRPSITHLPKSEPILQNTKSALKSRKPSLSTSSRPQSRRSGSETPSMRTPKRRDSLAPHGGLREQLVNMLQEVAVEEGDEDMLSKTQSMVVSSIDAAKIEKLEASMQKMEKLLERICKGLGVETDDDAEDIAHIVPPLEDEDSKLEAERNI